MKKKVLFICTHNSARSHMAEGILRHLYGDRFEAYSAGTTATEVRPQAAQVMGEIGIDLSSHRSKSVNEFLGRDIDYVVTVCDQARETCPFFPGGKEYIHQGFADPSTLTGPEEDVLAGYRRVLDEIKDWVEKTFRNK